MSEVDSGARWWRSGFTLPDGGRSFSEMWAAKNEAKEIAAERRFDPPKRFRGSVKEFRPSVLASLLGGLLRPDVFHSACYIGFLAARSGVVDAEDLVCDGSALHELSHFIQGGSGIRDGKQREITIAALRNLESITLGIPPLEISLILPEGQ